jgi:hypothetical protein
MKLLPDDITTTQRTATPEMILLGVDVGYRSGDASATPAETAFCRAIVKALFAAARTGGYPQPDTGHMLLALFTSSDPLRTAQAICDCITPKAWKAAMQRPDFEATCRIE